MMSEETHPLADLTDEALQALLGRSVRITLIMGLIGSVAIWIGSGWRNAAMLAVGAAISAASILEWRRLIRYVNAKLDKRRPPTNGLLVGASFVLRLTVFAAAIYVSLKCFRGTVVALLCGLALAVAATAWEALRLLKE